MNLTRLVTAAAAVGLLAAGCGTATGPAGRPPAPAPGASSPSPASPSPASPSPPSPSASSPVSPVPWTYGYQPLFPFPSLTAAQAWQASYEAGGHQPWHLSADLTALAFTRGYLGFTGVSRVAAHTVGQHDARVTVGLPLPNGSVSRAAVIHLVRYGSGPHAPWEAVGTDDTTLTLDTPAYGGTATSPVTVGGTITGVDESLAVAVHRLGSASPAGSYCCQPAGGERSRWSARVTFHAPAGEVLTIVVHTGGHLAPVERFAVTGVRAG